MIQRVFLVSLAILLSLGSAAGAGVDLTGNWRAKVYGHLIEAVMNQNGHALNGVAYLHSPGGKRDTFHFKGSISGGAVELAHHSGHRFSGKVTKDGRIAGILTTKEGARASVQLSRH